MGEAKSKQQLHEIVEEFVSKLKPLCNSFILLVKDEGGTELTMNSSVFEGALMLASYMESLNEKRRNMTLSILSVMKKTNQLADLHNIMLFERYLNERNKKQDEE